MNSNAKIATLAALAIGIFGTVIGSTMATAAAFNEDIGLAWAEKMQAQGYGTKEAIPESDSGITPYQAQNGVLGYVWLDTLVGLDSMGIHYSDLTGAQFVWCLEHFYEVLHSE